VPPAQGRSVGLELEPADGHGRRLLARVVTSTRIYRLGGARDYRPTTVREYEELVRQIFPMLRLGEVLSGSPA
jgi:hypothetical protein